MPVERRSLRSNKDSSSTNSSSRDRPSHSQTTSKSKAAPTKKPTSDQTAKVDADAKPVANGTEPMQNGVNGSQDIEMNGESSSGDKMTVVVPPSKESQASGEPRKPDDAMDVDEHPNSEEAADKGALAVARKRLPNGMIHDPCLSIHQH